MRRLLAALIALTLSSTLPGAARPGAALSQRQSAYAVVLILDGARPDYFNLAPMRHLRSLQRAGMTYTNAFVGQEPANTPPSHATIGTGVFPRRHGIQGFWWKDPRTGSMTRPTDLDAVQRGALEDV
jgi:predicted AlkP superfamily pyrophosphatase or phosphodiesterase